MVSGIVDKRYLWLVTQTIPEINAQQSLYPFSHAFLKRQLSTILMTFFLDEMKDSDSERKEVTIKTEREEEKKENDMIIFQEMITIPNQEESDEVVGGRCHMLAKFYRIKSWVVAPLNDLVLNVGSVINHAGIAYLV